MAKNASKVDRLRQLREVQAKESEATPFERHSAEVRGAIQRGRAAFEDLGAALSACKESSSWREKYTSWTEACESEWGISRRHANRLIEGVRIMDLIGTGPTGPTESESPPMSERAVREFSGVPDEKVPEVAERASALANGKPPTSSHVKEAKGEILQFPTPEPNAEPEGDEPDPYDELERVLHENRRLSDLVEQIAESDAQKEVARWSERYARLEGRVSQMAQTTKQAENTAKYATGVLRKVRKALGVERDRDILPAIQALLA